MIEVEGLTKRFGTLTALENLHLRVDRGEVFGFLGPNGAGKSTATKLLCTLLHPTAGAARICGFDVVEEATEVRRRIGYLPEKVPVFKPLTAREDLRHFGRLQGMDLQTLPARIESTLERVGLADVDGRACGTFSKGMTQRLGLARAILHDPDVLFLDEPASGLDPTGRRMIRDLMRNLATEGRTIWLTSHDLGEVRAVAKRIGFIRHSRLVGLRHVGEADEGRLLELEVEGVTEAVLTAVRKVPGALLVEGTGDRVRVRGAPAMDRREVARAVRRGGGTLLYVEEKEASLDDLYQAYVEENAPSAEAEEPPAVGKEVNP